MRMYKIGYARVSTNEIRQGLGLEVQKNALKEKRCNKIFDETESGTKDDRPKFKQALDLAREKALNGFNVIFIVYKLDRLARHLVKTVSVIDGLKKDGIQVVSLQEDIDTSTAAGVLQYQMLAMFAEFEVNQTRQRTRDALAELKKQGKVLGRPRIKPKVEKEVCRLYQLPEYPISKIAQVVNISEASVYNIAKQNNLSRRRKSMTS